MLLSNLLKDIITICYGIIFQYDTSGAIIHDEEKALGLNLAYTFKKVHWSMFRSTVLIKRWLMKKFQGNPTANNQLVLTIFYLQLSTVFNYWLTGVLFVQFSNWKTVTWFLCDTHTCWCFDEFVVKLRKSKLNLIKKKKKKSEISEQKIQDHIFVAIRNIYIFFK